VFQRVFLSLVLDSKGNGIFGKGKASTMTLSVSYILCPTHELPFISFSKGEKFVKASSFLCFFAINAKGGEVIRTNQKDHTTTLFSKQKRGEINRHLQKPSWQLRGELIQGELLFNQRKSIWNRGRIFKNFKMLLEIIFSYHWQISKEFEKTSPKDLQKQAMWCKCGPKC
jgi:hypothetical protein